MIRGITGGTKFHEFLLRKVASQRFYTVTAIFIPKNNLEKFARLLVLKCKSFLAQLQFLSPSEAVPLGSCLQIEIDF